MKIEKLPSGSYRVRRTYNKRSYSIIFDHRPTQKEVEKEMFDRIGRQTNNRQMTFQDLAEMYMKDKSNVLSPSTLRGYRNNLNGLSDKFKTMKADNIKQADVQREVNLLAERISAKTVKNYHGFISSVLALYRPDLRLNTKLPMIVHEEPYIPSVDELRSLYKEAEGTQYLLCLYLGSLGMRRSEICALQEDDIDMENNIIHIRKAMVQNSDDEWIVKNTTKTAASTRDIIVPDNVIEEIRRNGLYKGHPHTITDWMRRTEERLGMKHFSFHKLRHAFCSYGKSLGLSDIEIQKYGGWSTDFCMKKVYLHSLKSSQVVSDSIGKEFFG